MAFSYAWAVIKILYFESIGLTFQEISFVLIMIPLISFLIEIPSGLFTDLYGRKKSIVLSFLLCNFSSWFLLYADSLGDLMISSFLYGISWGFWSGSFESLLYESTVRLRIRKIYQKILTHLNFIFTALGILTNLLIPYMFDLNKSSPFILMICMSFILITLSLFLKETEIIKKKRIVNHNFKEQFLSSFNFVIKNPSIKFFIMFNAIWGSCTGVFASLINQPLIYKYYDLVDYGFIFSITTIFQTCIIYFTDSIIDYLKKYNIFLVLTIIWSLLLYLITIFINNLYVLIPLMGILWSVGSIMYVFFSTRYNNSIKDDNIRASVLSFTSMINSFFYVLSTYLFGYLLDTYNIITNVNIMNILYLIIGLILSLYIKNIYIKNK